jgi:hypothetical protein
MYNHCSVTSDRDTQEWIDRLKSAAEVGEFLDLAPRESVERSKSATWPAERTMAVAAVRAVLTDPDVRVDPRGLRIRAARFGDLLDLAYVDFAHPLYLIECVLEGGLYAPYVRLRELGLVNITANGEIRAPGATIGGQLNLGGATLRNIDGNALALDQAQITGGVFASDGFHADGEIRATGATIGGQLDLRGATLNNPTGNALALESATVAQLLLEPQKWDGSLNLAMAKIGDLKTAEHPPGPLTATGWTVGDLHGPLRDNWRRARQWLETAKPDHDSSGWSRWWRKRTAWLRHNNRCRFNRGTRWPMSMTATVTPPPPADCVSPRPTQSPPNHHRRPGSCAPPTAWSPATATTPCWQSSAL